MDHDEYEIFEHLADGSLRWRGNVRGLQGARVKVSSVSDATGNECFAMDSTETEIVLARTPLRGAKQIFQVAYGNALAGRAHLMWHNGYDVTSVSSNRAAQLLLSVPHSYDLFVIGHEASGAVRLEMIRWMREHDPTTRIVALYPRQNTSDNLTYNAPSEPAAAWLPLISAAVAQGEIFASCVDRAEPLAG